MRFSRLEIIKKYRVEIPFLSIYDFLIRIEFEAKKKGNFRIPLFYFRLCRKDYLYLDRIQ